jgi:AcrR family transcriptional regulator
MENPTTKAAPRDADARRALLEAATGLFNAKGYAAATVREIVQAAGVTKPVLYYYFGSKEGIYLELMKSAFESFDRLLEGLEKQTGTAEERVLRFADATYLLFQNNVPVIRLMHGIYYGPPQGAPFFDFDAYHQKFQDTVEKYVGEGVRTGELRKGLSREAAWALIGAVNTAMELQLCHPERALSRNQLRRVLQAIFDGIAEERALGSRRAGERTERKRLNR